MRGRGYQIDIMRSEFLQTEHRTDEPGLRERFSERSVLYGHILTENTLQITAGEKDRAAPARAADARLFIKMERGAGNFGNRGTAAKSVCGCSVNFTITRADIATHENGRLPHTKLRTQ